MFKTCPDPIDVQDLQFKLHCRLKVFNNKELNTFPNSYSLISCASRYGLLFVGSHTSNLQVIQLKCVENYSPKDKDISNYPRRNVPLLSPPQHISVNCDSTILAVVTERDNCPTVTFYDVLSFLKQNISLIKEVRLSPTPSTYVREIGWNPALPSIFTACKSDGTLGVYEINGTSISINELPAASEATCFCWSPKGKQIAVGSRNSRITQYKPDLKAVKVINQPPLEGSHSIISLHWVSNYQFIGIYQSTEPEGSAKLIVVDAPKTGDPVYTNYEDVCYSGTARLPRFYMNLLQHWNILLVASSNSTELGVLGSTGETWTQWIISDAARAELPLSSDHQETLPLGLALDISSTRPLPWNESTIPPCPYLLILSHHGVLCLFSVVILKAGAPGICAPPDPVSDLSGIQQFVVLGDNVAAPPKAIVAPTAPVQSLPPAQAPVFGAKILTQPQPTYAPVTLFGAKPADSKPLFGGQATITPIKPQQPTTQPLFVGQTSITPLSKQQTGTTPAVNPAEKYSSIFSALGSQPVAPPPTEGKNLIVSAQNLSKTAVSVEQQAVVQPKASVTPVKPTEPPKPEVNLKIKEETEVLLAQMLRDECVSLESELKALLHQGRMVKIDIGSEEEKVELIRKIESLQEFIKEIVDISVGENAEVHYLKQNLIQSWAWFEEARSRYNASKDETVSLLLRSQPLDSATEKKQADIRKMMYYIESQITQASKAMDEQWDNFQDYAKKVHRTKMPTMEAIFQAMVRQNVVLQKQTYILKDIASRLKAKSPVASIPSLLLSMGSSKDLEESLNRLKIDNPQDVCHMQYERVVSRSKNLSGTKTDKLRRLLKTRDVLHVTAVKPQLSSSLILQSPESKSKRLLSNLATLGRPVSPVSVTAAPVQKALSFVHSTPIRETKPNIKPTETPPNTPQIEAKTFTFKKVENSSLPTTNSFIPLSKSASVFSNLPQEGITQAPLATHSPSAFVPTQVNFAGGGSGKLFNFAPAATPSATITAKTVTPSIVTTTPAAAAGSFSFASATSTLPKFRVPLIQKPQEVAVTTSSTKPSLPQFGFGSGLSITPVSTGKKDSPSVTAATTAVFATGTAAKPTFSFGAGSSIFGANIAAESNPPQASAAVTSSNLFGNLSQVSKPSVATTASSSSIPFGIVPTSKFSAFSAVTTSASHLTLPTTTANLFTQREDSPTVSKPMFSTSSAIDTSSVKTTAMPINLADSADSTTTSVKPALSSATAKALPANITPSMANTSTSLAAVTATSVGGGPLVTTKPPTAVQTILSEVTSSSTPSSVKQSFSFGSVSITPVSATSSGLPVITVPTVTSAKPSSSLIPGSGTSTQSIFSGTPTNLTGIPAPAASVVSSTTPLPTTKPLVFGTTTTTAQPGFVSTSSQPSIFGSSNTQLQIGDVSPSQDIPGVNDNITSASIFGSSSASSPAAVSSTTVTSAQLSILGGTQAIGSTVGSTAQSTPIFDLRKTTSSTQPSIFASITTSAQPSSINQSIFGGTQTSGISTTTQTTSIFGMATAVSSTQASGFGASTNSSIFASTAAPKTTGTSIFGNAATITTQSSIFGTSTATSKSSVFGATSTTNPPPLFGTNTATSSQQGSIFGGGSSTSPASVFGATSSNAAPQSSIFGDVKPETTTKPSIFGAPQSSTTQSSIFAAGTIPSTQTSIFDTSSTTSASPFSSAFGSTSSPFGQTSSVFGAPKTTASTFGSGFGSPTGFGATPSTTSSIFGQPSSFGSTSSPAFGTPTTATNIFGSSTSTFGANTSANVFGSPSAPPSSSFSFAGAASNASSTAAFGFGGLNVGAPPTTTNAFGGGPAFGQTTASNPFNRPTEQKSPFGGGNTSIFGSPASSSGSVFGSNTGSTFSANTQGGFGTSSFGSPSTFGQQSTFGQSTFGNTSFGNVQPGPFSGGSGAVAQTGFGSPTSNFAKPSGFGSSPVFGGSPQPAFGAAPSFGGSPAFGVAPSFGSPNKIFGANTSASGFGTSSTASTGFGNLANQNTVGFGNLAQQASSPNNAPFSGSSSFSSWR